MTEPTDARRAFEEKLEGLIDEAIEFFRGCSDDHELDAARAAVLALWDAEHDLAWHTEGQSERSFRIKTAEMLQRTEDENEDLSDDIADLHTRLAAVEQENARLREVIRWALGEWGEFPSFPDGRRPGDGKRPRVGYFWWRSELRQRYAAAVRAPEPGGETP